MGENLFRWYVTMIGVGIGTTLGYVAASLLYVIAQGVMDPEEPTDMLPAFLIGLAVFVPFGAMMVGGLAYRWATRRLQG